MKIIDLNLILYAVNQDAPNHKAAHLWWEHCLSGKERIGLPWVVILGFIRIITNTRIMTRPLSHTRAIEIVSEWLELPNVQVLNSSERHWQILKELLLHLGTASNLTTDAHIAALAIEYGATLYSCDTDFLRFPNLKRVDPLQDN